MIILMFSKVTTRTLSLSLLYEQYYCYKKNHDWLHQTTCIPFTFFFLYYQHFYYYYYYYYDYVNA